ELDAPRGAPAAGRRRGGPKRIGGSGGKSLNVDGGAGRAEIHDRLQLIQVRQPPILVPAPSQGVARLQRIHPRTVACAQPGAPIAAQAHRAPLPHQAGDVVGHHWLIAGSHGVAYAFWVSRIPTVLRVLATVVDGTTSSRCDRGTRTRRFQV